MIELDHTFLRMGAHYRTMGWWRDHTLVDDFLAVAARSPDKEAIAAYALGTVEPVRLTFGALREQVDSIATGLLKLGIQPGEAVACQLPNCWEFVAVVLATYRVGAVICPIVPILRHREVSFILRETGARVVITRGCFRNFDYAAMYEAIARELDHPMAIYVTDVAETDGRSFTRQFLASGYDPELLEARSFPQADDVAEVLFTSGTTGEPKGVVHTHNTEYARTRACYEPLRLGEDDVVFMSSTMGHSSGFLYGLCAPVMLGMKAVYLDIHDADTMLDVIERERATWSMGSTTFIIDALTAQRHRSRDLSSFHMFASGGAPIPPQIVEQARIVLGARIMAIWGMTENGGVTTTPFEMPLEAAASSDGRPVEWMEIKVVDADNRPLPPLVTGMLKVRGASQTPGYLNRAALYREQLDAEGWFDTGDLAYLDAAGNVRISGRSKDMIIRGGENIPVVEIEAAIFTMPEVKEVAVIGYPDSRLGERACACVVLAKADTELPLSRLLDHLGSIGMSKTYFPEKLLVVDTMPKTLSGKIQKHVLRERLLRDC